MPPVAQLRFCLHNTLQKRTQKKQNTTTNHTVLGSSPNFNTAKWAALRAILAMAALEDMKLESIDISSAFLNGEQEEDVYMEQPEGFHQGAYDVKVW